MFCTKEFFLLTLYTGPVEYSQNNLGIISNETDRQRPDLSSKNKLAGSQVFLIAYDYNTKWQYCMGNY